MSMVSIVIGAGIVGLHVASVLKEKGHDVYVLEQEPYLGEHTSGRNSGVIHSGVFYKTDSFKEKICIEGNRLTYEWLQKLKVPYRPCGKWIVPEIGQENDLEPFFEKIRKLPIPAPEMKSAAQVQQEEPHLRPSDAILVPSTGILDAASYVKALSVYLEAQGVQVILNCRVLSVGAEILTTSRGDMPFDLVVNSAGLFADQVARMDGLKNYEVRPCRGDYYIVQKNLVNRPVYHLPYQGAHGLGVHLTPTIDHQLLLGPNAFFIEGKGDYRHRSDIAAFENSVRYFLPRLQGLTLTPAYSGNRPKLFLDGKPHPEFVILKQKNWIHLLGIESPGLTSAPALAKHLAALI